MDLHPYALSITAFFLVGYALITFEHVIKVNKATIALAMAIACWTIVFIAFPDHLKEVQTEAFLEDLAEISQIVFFLVGALAIVEVISVHKGFNLISNSIQTQSKKKLLLALSLITFFLSAALDNLTTTIVMLAILNKMVADRNDRWTLGGAIVIAANAGGAWSPIGDVTTTMLWIGGQLTSFSMVKDLFLPSFVCAAVGCALLSPYLKGDLPLKTKDLRQKNHSFLSKLFFFLGVGLLLLVPVFKIVTGLPPFMGILLALSILWIVTDIIHGSEDNKSHLRVPHILTQIDLSSVLFFLGILLAVAAIRAAGLLSALALWFDHTVGSPTLIATLIGLASAIVDNVPLVAAAMGMYDLTLFPTDHYFWQLIAFCAGTGGSILVIGSAAGVVFMSMEKIDFFSYLKRIGLPAFGGYLSGILTYILLT